MENKTSLGLRAMPEGVFLGRGFTRNFWMPALQLEKDTRECGFIGKITVEDR